MTTTVIKSSLEVNLVKGSSPELHGLTQVKPGKIEKKYLKFKYFILKINKQFIWI